MKITKAEQWSKDLESSLDTDRILKLEAEIARLTEVLDGLNFIIDEDADCWEDAVSMLKTKSLSQ